MRKVTFAVLGALLALPACSKHSRIVDPGSTPDVRVSYDYDPVGPTDERRRTATDPVPTPPTEYIPPLVTIVSPRPSALITAILPPTARIQWQGLDGSAGPVTRLVHYAYRLFSQDEEIDLWIANPDSLRRRSTPLFEGWTFVDPSVTEVTFTNLAPNERYLFVVTSVDQAGETNPVFSLNTNMLRMRIAAFDAAGPRLTLYNQNFSYTYPTGGFPADPPLFSVFSQAGVPFTLNWSAVPLLGTQIHAYRWVLDPEDLLDETPRTGPNDTGHWSEWSLGTSATVGPLAAGVYRLYVEVRDTAGFISIGGVKITAE